MIIQFEELFREENHIFLPRLFTVFIRRVYYVILHLPTY